MTWPAVVLWIAILAGALSRGPALLYLFAVTAVFGSLQMIPGELIGGANVLPQSVCAALLVVKVLSQPGNALRALAAAIDPAGVVLFTGFVLYALFTAFVLPRLFLGQIEVVPVSAAISGTTLLAPSAANITQCGYMILSFATALAFCLLGGRPEVQRHYLHAVLLGAVALVGTGVVDLGLYSAGASSLLEPFRNASYNLLTDVEAVGSKRVVGLLPEASTYGVSCVTALAALTFLRPCFDAGLRRFVGLVVIGLLLMAALSTSTSAFVGLAVFGPLYALNWAIRSLSPTAPYRESITAEATLILLAAFAALLSFVAFPSLFDPAYQMIDVMVFQKTSSASYVERSMWTSVGWNAFLDTGGLGVGFGSVRTSNWFVSILGSTGAFGGLLLFGFVLRLLLARVDTASAYNREFIRALRFSVVPGIVMSWFGGTIPDIGAGTASIYGVIAANLMLAAERTRAREKRALSGPLPPAEAPLRPSPAPESAANGA